MRIGQRLAQFAREGGQQLYAVQRTQRHPAHADLQRVGPRGQARLDPNETLELCWFDPDQLPKSLMPNSARTLKAFQRYRRTGKFQMI